MNGRRMIVGIIDGDGKLCKSQEYSEFHNRGKRNIEILNLYTGKKLFDILMDDLGKISYKDNKLTLSIIYSLNPHDTTMQLLGKIAEAVIVRRCEEDEELNREWLSLASRKKKIKRKIAEKFKAIGTGLERTKREWFRQYNFSDPQRDVIWVNRETEEIANMKSGSVIASKHAGLQVKTSCDGKTYFLNDLWNYRYEVPVVYFDINNDFDKVAQELWIRKSVSSGYDFVIGEDFISARAVDYEGFDEVKFYFDLVLALVENRLTLEDLLNEGERNKTLGNAVIATGLEAVGFDTEIIR